MQHHKKHLQGLKLKYQEALEAENQKNAKEAEEDSALMEKTMQVVERMRIKLASQERIEEKVKFKLNRTKNCKKKHHKLRENAQNYEILEQRDKFIA